MAEQSIPIYSGRPKDFSWVGFGSGSGTNLRECNKTIKPKLIFSDRPKAGLLELEELRNVPKKVIDGYKFCGSWKKAMGNPEAEKAYRKKSVEYNQLIVEELKNFERASGKSIDLIVLGGYMRLIEKPLLDAYQDKIINVHPADLSILENGKRKYVGDNAVYDAIMVGETETRSSVIIVDELVDHGEILTQGSSVEVWEEVFNFPESKREEFIVEYSGAHQEMQKMVSDWPALTTALKLIAYGRLALGTEKTFNNEWRTAYLDGNALGYGGYKVNLKRYPI